MVSVGADTPAQFIIITTFTINSAFSGLLVNIAVQIPIPFIYEINTILVGYCELCNRYVRSHIIFDQIPFGAAGNCDIPHFGHSCMAFRRKYVCYVISRIAGFAAVAVKAAIAVKNVSNKRFITFSLRAFQSWPDSPRDNPWT